MVMRDGRCEWRCRGGGGRGGGGLGDFYAELAEGGACGGVSGQVADLVLAERDRVDAVVAAVPDAIGGAHAIGGVEDLALLARDGLDELHAVEGAVGAGDGDVLLIEAGGV